MMKTAFYAELLTEIECRFDKEMKSLLGLATADILHTLEDEAALKEQAATR